MKIISRFFDKADDKILLSLSFLMVTHWLQIPHFIWGGDAILKTGSVYNVNPVWDFVLYSIDLIEIPAIIAVTISFIARYRNKKE